MEWRFDCQGGTVTVRQEGERVVCQAVCHAEGQGLYKAWLVGEEGKALLGTLIPENGALRLRRNMSVYTLKEKGAWPPAGAEIVMAYAFAPENLSDPRWRWSECPCRLFEDKTISHALRGVDRGLVRRDADGFFLAFPYVPGCPFPVPPLFCLGQMVRMGKGWYILFRFSRQGAPELLHNFPPDGDNDTVI